MSGCEGVIWADGPKTFPRRLCAQMLEVGANTRVREVCESIAARLQLASWEGCSLFIKITDKVQLADGPGQRGRSRQGVWRSLPVLAQAPHRMVRGCEGKGRWVHGAHGPPNEQGPSAPQEGTPQKSLHLCTFLYLPPHAPQVISQKEGDFFFDSLRQVSDWVKKSKPQKEGGVSAGQGGARMEGAGRGLSASLGQGQKAPLASPAWPMPFHSLPLVTSKPWVRPGLDTGGEGPALGALPA